MAKSAAQKAAKRRKIEGSEGGGWDKSRALTRPIGSYASPSSKAIVSLQRAPQMVSKPQGVRIQNTEKWFPAKANVSAGGSWGLHAFSPTSLPWLSGIALNYQRYKIHKAVISYVTNTSTTENGYIELASFYDVEDGLKWVSNGPANDTLAACPEYAMGPLYAGGSISGQGPNVYDDNWFGLHIDTKAVHRAYPWLSVDVTPTINETGNLSRGFSVAVRGVDPNYAEATTMGTVFITYDIEFIQPVAAVNQPL